MSLGLVIGVGSLLTILASSNLSAQTPIDAGRHRVEVTSTVDGSPQPSFMILPPGYDHDGADVPVVVS